MPQPTFLCIGSQKCGTTWLSHCVRQHPEVCTAPQKEVGYWNDPGRLSLGIGWYESQFKCAPGVKAVGEFSPNYFWTVGTPSPPWHNHTLGSADRLAETYPDLRLIVMLRDPVERAVSGYYHDVRGGRFSPSHGPMYYAHKWPHGIEFGRYDVNLEAWFEQFPREAFLILIYEEDVRPDAAKPGTLRRVFRHIGVDPDFVPNGVTARKNVRDSHFKMRAWNAPRPVRALMGLVPPALRSHPVWDITVPDADRAALAAEYAPGVKRLEAMLGREMPWPATKRAAAIS